MSNELYKKWKGLLNRIFEDQLQDLLTNRHVFQSLKTCTAPYIGTCRGADLFEWMVQNYIAFAATAIRRMIEKPNTTWNSISLRILLEDLAANDTVLTRKRYRSLYKNPEVVADRDFNKIARSKDADYVSAARIKKDIKEIEDACDRVVQLVNKVVAHTEEDRGKVGKFKYGEIDSAVTLLEKTFQRYSLLVDGSKCDPLVPLDDIDVRADLEKIWPRVPPP